MRLILFFHRKNERKAKKMKKWVCALVAVLMVISAMAVASAEPGYESVKNVLKNEAFLGDYDYSIPASGEGYSTLLRTIRETTGEYGTLVFMYIDLSEGKLGIIGQNAKGVQEFTLWTGIDKLDVYGMLYIFADQYDTISGWVDGGSFIILYALDDDNSTLIQDSQTAAAVFKSLSEALNE